MSVRRKRGRKPRERVEPHFGRRKGASNTRNGGRKRKPPAKPKRSWLGRGLRFFAFCAIWGAILLGAAMVYYTARLPDPILATLDQRPPNLTILAADGTVMAERGLRRGHVRLEHLPPYLTQAVIAIEDRRFYKHFGVDPIGLVRAATSNFAAGGVVEGGSTITQQLAKNLFLQPDRTMARKLKELVYALWLEQRFGKDEILELYLNRVYFGGGAYGVEAASRHFFGKSARNVDLAEAAMLAGLLKAPSRYSPMRSADLATGRAELVLGSMVDAGFITEDQAARTRKHPAEVKATGDLTGYPYAVDWVADLLPGLILEDNADLIVETTIDAGLQRTAQRLLRQTLDGEGAALGAGEGAIVVLDTRGAIKALVGGRAYRASPFNRAVRAFRQPGSAFKPFVYLAALEAGYAPDSVAYDEPIKLAGWTPKNYTNDYRGAVTLRQGLSQSINTVAVRLADDVGRWRVVRTARRLGIGSPLHENPSIALGTAEVSLLELTGAYTPLANGGYGVQPHIVMRVRDGEGRVLHERRQAALGQVIALSFVGAMNEMMNATIRHGTARQAGFPTHPAAGKTGTSQNFRDAWFVGYTAHYVGGIWIGNDDGAPMRKVTGGSLPAKIWRDVMIYAHENKEPRSLPGASAPALQHAFQPSQQARGEDETLLRRIFGLLSGG
jgi:penicillin-binding protein 1A